MDIQITTKKNVLLTSTLERRMRIQLTEILAQFSRDISFLEVELSLLPGEGEKLYKKCLVRANLRAGGSVAVEEIDYRSVFAVVRAARRIAEACDRRLVSNHQIKFVAHSMRKEESFYIE